MNEEYSTLKIAEDLRREAEAIIYSRKLLESKTKRVSVVISKPESKVLYNKANRVIKSSKFMVHLHINRLKRYMHSNGYNNNYYGRFNSYYAFVRYGEREQYIKHTLVLRSLEDIIALLDYSKEQLKKYNKVNNRGRILLGKYLKKLSINKNGNWSYKNKTILNLKYRLNHK